MTLFSLFIVLPLLAFQAIAGKKNFFCDYLGTPFFDKGNHPNQYFNRMFFYKKISQGIYQADFKQGLDYGPVSAKIKNNFLYHAYSPNRYGDWEVYRFHIKTGVLTKSWVHYTKAENYDEHVRRFKKFYPYAPPFSQGPFLELVEEPPKIYKRFSPDDGSSQVISIKPNDNPANYIKLGYDGSQYQCHEVWGIKYFFRHIGVSLMQIFGA